MALKWLLNAIPQSPCWLHRHVKRESIFYVLVLVGAASATSPNVCRGTLERYWASELQLPHARCDRFYTCSRGAQRERACPRGLLYDASRRLCDYRHLVHCGNRTIGDTHAVEPAGTYKDRGSQLRTRVISVHNLVIQHVSLPNYREQSSSAVYSSPSDVTTPTPTTNSTPIYNRNKKIIAVGDNIMQRLHHGFVSYPHNNNYTIGRTGDSVQVETLANGCPVDPTVFRALPDPADCSRFFYCQLGERVLRQCSAGLHYNRIQEVCDWPENGSCNGNLLEVE